MMAMEGRTLVLVDAENVGITWRSRKGQAGSGLSMARLWKLVLAQVAEACEDITGLPLGACLLSVHWADPLVAGDSPYSQALRKTVEHFGGHSAVHLQRRTRTGNDETVLKNTTDIGITIEAVERAMAAEVARVVLVAGDVDYSPLVTWLAARGIRLDLLAPAGSASKVLGQIVRGLGGTARSFDAGTVDVGVAASSGASTETFGRYAESALSSLRGSAADRRSRGDSGVLAARRTSIAPKIGS